MSTNGTTKPIRWFENPARNCIGDPSFTDDVDGRKQKEIERMLYACMTCPVIKACYGDAKDNPWREGTIQGGEIW